MNRFPVLGTGSGQRVLRRRDVSHLWTKAMKSWCQTPGLAPPQSPGACGGRTLRWQSCVGVDDTWIIDWLVVDSCLESGSDSLHTLQELQEVSLC